MGIFDELVDTVFGGGQKAAGDAMSAGYGDAMNYMRPYYEGGKEDYGKYRSEINNFGDSLQGYGNPYDWGWKNSGADPRDFLKTLMSGYTETPEAKYAQDQMMKQVTQGMNASGTLGSGAMYKTLQDRGYDIVARDQDRYLQRIGDVNDRQMQYGSNYQNQQNSFRNFLDRLASMGTNSANQMSQYAIGKGNANAQSQLGEASGWDELINFGASIAPAFL
jgi:hypothetical protein